MPDHPTFDGADPAAVGAFQTALDDLVDVTSTAAALRPHLEVSPTFVDGQLLLVLLCLADDDTVDAHRRLANVEARRSVMTRRQRQLTELVHLAVSKQPYRFHALSCEHLAEHPDDHRLLTAAEIALARATRPSS
jgi:hypothetical protein